MEELLKQACTQAPVFRVNAVDVSFLSHPEEFYETILKRIDSSTEKILISSLYIGTDKLSTTLIKHLEERLKNVPKLKLQLIIDHSRGSRDVFNSFSLINPLLSQFGSERVQVLAYKNPYSRRYYRLPVKLKEFAGVHHMKFLAFDNSVILTGANLNETYFRDRVDRYIILDNAKDLVNYLGQVFARLTGVYEPLNNENRSFQQSNAQQPFMSLPQSRDDSFVSNNLDNDSVYIVPAMQLAKHDIFQDSTLLEQLLQSQEPFLKEDSQVLFCTSYFNPRHSFIEQILKSNAAWNILTAAPQANSFYGAKGAIGMVPHLYQRRLHLFAKEVQNRKANVNCFEFIRPGLTFHAKGFLSYLNDESTFSCIGSSNFGFRSAHSDNEIQFYMMSRNADFNEKMSKSFKDLFAYGKLFDNNSTNHSFLTKLVSAILKKFL